MAYGDSKAPPRVYLQNVDSNRRELMGNFPGMSFAPRFSPDGTKVAMSLSQDGRTNLYEMDVRGRGHAPADQHACNRHFAVATPTTERKLSSTPTAAAASSSMS